MNFKPVIFLAFANDKVDQALYLRNLSAEMHGIREALSKAVSSGLCEIVERSSATVGDIINVFQDPIYGPRVSIFHYAGHADGFSLLLEAVDGSKVLTHKDGLVPFLARQQNLKLVFLNGCSSEGQTTDLLKAGISAVIGTTTAINDAVATGLAVRFYASLGEGAGIEKAWMNATDEVKITSGTTDTRALFWEGKKENTGHFPWVMQFRPGAEILKEWNLPDISGNPLYGLPPIPLSYNLPESPFLYLNRYERKHAEIFFGRSYNIRSLFLSISDLQAPSIVLLSGQSGAGKSSLLEAGLQARLESKFEMMYLRRIGAVGLSNTLYYALLEKSGFTPEVSTINNSNSSNHVNSELDSLKQFVSSLSESYQSRIMPVIEQLTSESVNPYSEIPEQQTCPPDIKSAWKLVEKKFGRPLLVILDQVEEAYTRSAAHLPDEISQLFLELKNLFGNPATLPAGKIILGFRKEFFPEIELVCSKYELPRSKFFIEHFSKQDILEFFQGFMTSPRLKSRYNLSIEDGLPEVIIADLAADKDAPIAPMLQILLTKMWNKATALNPNAPKFSFELYRELKEKGLAMDEFLQTQLLSIREKLPEYYDLGFVLDVLFFYCSINNTATAHTEKELLEHYPFVQSAAKRVVEACIDHLLLTEVGDQDNTTVLSLDSLAKSVVKMQQRSAQPLQQGKRILHSRLEAKEAGSEFAIVDSWELKLIEKVQEYMPAFTEEEKRLFESSRTEIHRREKLQRRNVNYFRGIIVLSILGSIVSWFLYSKSKLHEKESFVNMMSASSRMNLLRDPSLSIRQALDGLRLDADNLELKKLILNAYYHSEQNKILWYKNIFKSANHLTGIKYFAPDKTSILLNPSDSLEIIDSTGSIIGYLSVQDIDSSADLSGRQFTEVTWSRDGHHIIALDDAGRLNFYTGKGSRIKDSPKLKYRTFDYNETNNKIVALRTQFEGQDSWADFFDDQGNKIDSINISASDSRPYFISKLKFDGPGNHIIVGKTLYDEHGLTIECVIQLIDLRGSTLFSKHLDGNSYGGIGAIHASPNGQRIAALFTSQYANDFLQAWNQKLLLYNSDGKLLNELVAPMEHPFTEVSFHPADDFYLALMEGQGIISGFDGSSIDTLFTDQIKMRTSGYSEDGASIFAGGDDNLGRICDNSGNLKYKLVGHTLPVMGIAMTDSISDIYTVSSDGTVKSWTPQNFNHTGISDMEDAADFYPDPSGHFILVPEVNGLKYIYDVRSDTKLIWKCLASGYNHRWYFLDSTMIVGVSSNEIQLFRPQFDTMRLLSPPAGSAQNMHPVTNVTMFGDQIVTMTREAIDFWSKDGVYLKTIIPDPSPDYRNNIMGLAVSNARNLMAVGIWQGRYPQNDSCFVLLYDSTGHRLGSLNQGQHRYFNFEFSRDGEYLISYTDQVCIQNINQPNTRIIYPLDCNPAKGPECRLKAVHMTGNSRIITVSSEGSIKIWNFQGQLLNSFQTNVLNLANADFTPDGNMIYSYDADSTLHLWSLDGELIHTYHGHLALFKPGMDGFYTIKKTFAGAGATMHKSEFIDYYTPEGAFQHIKSQKQFNHTPKTNLNGKLMEWLGFK